MIVERFDGACDFQPFLDESKIYGNDAIDIRLAAFVEEPGDVFGSLAKVEVPVAVTEASVAGPEGLLQWGDGVDVAGELTVGDVDVLDGPVFENPILETDFGVGTHEATTGAEFGVVLQQYNV